MFSKVWLLLYANVALFIYATVEMIKILVKHDNFFTHFLNNIFVNVKLLTDQILSALTAWQNLLYLALFALLIFLLIKFWRVTFVLLEIITAFLLLDYVILFVSHEIRFENAFVIAVIIITLMNIWQTSRELRLM
ncbi:hypothetical protein [Lactococcus protaetiae]|uniref:Uncharacterized protein n=1 Tax=Lactococcus protaetiae TaxID=2592653 RepID=A0A514ZA00_9LACT|nr:hypothetical protein [Lactococcus protaetiae]QDK71412.1 hypothetical protein FLP15_09895 [Lactococcus protaetiae]